MNVAIKFESAKMLRDELIARKGQAFAGYFMARQAIRWTLENSNSMAFVQAENRKREWRKRWRQERCAHPSQHKTAGFLEKSRYWCDHCGKETT